MQPNQPQGYYPPDQQQPPVPPSPAAPQQQSVAQPVQSVGAAAMDAALNEPAPATMPVQQVAASEEQFADNQVNEEYAEDDYDESEEAPVTWVAHEYIHQEKGTLWFVAFVVVILVLLAVSIFIMNSWSFAVLLGVIAVVVLVYSKRPPRELTYSLTDEGLTVDGRLHEFSSFKSFGIIRDGEEFSVMLIPTQRFQPGVTVYFPEESGEAIVDMLGSRLPMKDLKLDLVDRAVRLLRL